MIPNRGTLRYPACTAWDSTLWSGARRWRACGWACWPRRARAAGGSLSRRWGRAWGARCRCRGCSWGACWWPPQPCQRSPSRRKSTRDTSTRAFRLCSYIKLRFLTIFNDFLRYLHVLWWWIRIVLWYFWWVSMFSCDLYDFYVFFVCEFRVEIECFF